MASRLHQPCAVTIHRLIEQHAALRGHDTAIVESGRRITYRDLNYAANAMARRLLASGFRRGAHATIVIPVGIDAAVVLLAVLKLGGAYTWRDPGPFARTAGLSFGSGGEAPVLVSGLPNGEAGYTYLDLTAALAAPVACSPNLPIITRASDVACILHDADGSPAVIVPHSTITALQLPALPQPTPWGGESGAFDLWMALMAGSTAVVQTHGAAVAA